MTAKALRVGLTRFWIALSAGSIVWEGWWAVAHNCRWDAADIFYCTGENFTVIGFFSLFLRLPAVLLIIALAAYWIVRGFSLGPKQST
jgi:hypothetical protein